MFTKESRPCARARRKGELRARTGALFVPLLLRGYYGASPPTSYLLSPICRGVLRPPRGVFTKLLNNNQIFLNKVLHFCICLGIIIQYLLCQRK